MISLIVFTVWSALVLTIEGSPACDSLEIITREQWGARPPTSVSYLSGAVNMSFVHYSAGPPCFDQAQCEARVRGIQNYHMDSNGWSDIGYSFLIGEDGRIYEGRGWGVVGAHTLNYNTVAHGFCIMGDFMDHSPNTPSLEATQNIIECGVELGYTIRDYELFGHRDGRCTTCPGDYLYAIIRGWPHYSFRSIPIYC